MARVTLPTTLDESFESVPVPEGEYDLRIEGVEQKTSKSDNEMLEVRISVQDPDYPRAPMIYHYLMLADGEDPKRDMSRMRDIKRFLTVFSIPYDGNSFDTDDFQGAEGRCLVRQETNEETNEVSNRIRLPRVRDEGPSDDSGEAEEGETRRRRRRA